MILKGGRGWYSNMVFFLWLREVGGLKLSAELFWVKWRNVLEFLFFIKGGLSQIIFTGKALMIVHCNTACILNSNWRTEMTQVSIIHIQMTMWRYKQSYLGTKWPRLLFFVHRCDLDSVYVAKYLSEQNKENTVKTLWNINVQKFT